MNDLLMSLALVISFFGFVGLVKRLEPLNRSRWAGAGLLVAGVFLAVAAGTRSDDGSEPGASQMQLDDFMPEYDFNEIHAIRISAPPSRVYQAMKAVSLRDVGVANVLFWIRSLPNRISGRPTSTSDHGIPLFRTDADSPFLLLAEENEGEWVAGLIGAFWNLRDSKEPTIRNPSEFMVFQRPGFAKVAFNFYVEEKTNGCRLSTETRILATDAIARRKFARYWMFIQPGSAMLRRAVLKAIKGNAEREVEL